MGILNHQLQNFHFVGVPSHYAPFKAPRTADNGSFSPSLVETTTHIHQQRHNMPRRPLAWTVAMKSLGLTNKSFGHQKKILG
uniref:Uncharacterized protein n=1 Tax=Arundo donax TaxID=35708 RepID=A0A0A8XUT3_ARUDO